MLQSYHTAFWWSAAFFAVGAVVWGLLIPAGVPAQDPDAEPVLVH